MGRRVQQSSIRCRAGPPPGQTMAQRITPPASPPGSQVHPPPPVVKHGPSTVFEPCQAQCDSGGSGLHLATALVRAQLEIVWSRYFSPNYSPDDRAVGGSTLCAPPYNPPLPGQKWMRRRWLQYFSLNKAQCFGEMPAAEHLSASLRGVLPV